MGDRSGIEWTDATWNPVVGCTRVSEGCRHCYAERLSARFSGIPGHKFEGTAKRLSADGADGAANSAAAQMKGEARWTGVVRCVDAAVVEPLRWKKPRRIFVNSVSDTFHEKVPFDFVDRMFAVMALCPQHVFQVLTKRPERMAEYVNSAPMAAIAPWIQMYGSKFRGENVLAAPSPFVKDAPVTVLGESPLRWPLPNVWLGTSVEDQGAAEARVPWLLRCPAAVRFLSCEPLLGAVDLRNIRNGDRFIDALMGLTHDGTDHPFALAEVDHLHWVIAGGESGPNARACHPDWVRGIRDQCVSAGVPLFFKQWGDWAPADGNLKRGHSWVIPSGKRLLPEDVVNWDDKRCSQFVGKKAAGRLLDGRVWDEMPGQRAAVD